MDKSYNMSFLIQKEVNRVEVNVNVRTLAFMKEASLMHLGEQLSDLNFDQAAGLVGGVYVAIAEAGDARVTLNGLFVIDAVLDGSEAIVGHANLKADELRPRIDDERVLVLNVLGSKKVWDTIIGRSRKIEQILRFSNTTE